MIYKIIRTQAIGDRDFMMSLRSLDNYEKFIIFVEGAYPYCFVRADQYDQIEGRHKRNIEIVEDEGYVDLWGNKVYTLYLDHPRNVAKLRKDNEYEMENGGTQSIIMQADIIYELAVLLKKGIFRYIEIKQPLKSWMYIQYDELLPAKQEDIEQYKIPDYIKRFVDIEVLSDGDVPSYKNPRMPIICVQVDDVIYINTDYRDHKQIVDKYSHQLMNRETTVKKYIDESLMLKDVYEHIVSGDIAIAWNSDFDERYLEVRSRKLGTSLEWRIVQWFDAQEAFAKQMKFSTSYISLKDTYDLIFKYKRKKWKLLPDSFENYYDIHETEDSYEVVENRDDEAYQYAKFRKTQSGGDVSILYNSKRYDELLFYNSCDVYDMMALEKVCGIDAYLSLFDVLNPIRLNDVFVHTFKQEPNFLGFCMLNGVASPSSNKGLSSKTEEGAIVHTPKTGEVLDYVIVFDFSRFYPSIIRARQVSTENEPDSDNEKLFTKFPDGREVESMYMMPALSKYFVEERDKIEEQMRKYKDKDEYKYNNFKSQKVAIKDFTSGKWGYVASPRTRYYKSHVANQILKESRSKNMALKNYFENNVIAGNVFIGVYGDTDSVFAMILGKAILDEDGKYKRNPNYNEQRYNNPNTRNRERYHPFLYEELEDVRSIDFNAIEQQVNEFLIRICDEDEYPYPIQISSEKMYEKLVLVGKKNYYGNKIWDDGQWLDESDYDIKGLQTIKSNQEQFSKDFQYAVIVNHLKGGMKSLRKVVNDYRKQIEKGFKQRRETGDYDIDFIESVSYPSSIKRNFKGYTHGYKKYVVEGCKAWNKFIDDEVYKIKKGSKVLVLPLKTSRNEHFKGVKYLAYNDASKIDWSEFVIDTKKVFEKNIVDKIKNILGSLGVSDNEIDAIVKGRKGRKLRI